MVIADFGLRIQRQGGRHLLPIRNQTSSLSRSPVVRLQSKRGARRPRDPRIPGRRPVGVAPPRGGAPADAGAGGGARHPGRQPAPAGGAAGVERLPEHTDAVTVYRTLNTFTDKQLVHRVRGEDRTWRYALSGKASPRQPQQPAHSHAHFVCETCGTVECLEDAEIPGTSSVPSASAPGVRRPLPRGRPPRRLPEVQRLSVVNPVSLPAKDALPPYNLAWLRSTARVARAWNWTRRTPDVGPCVHSRGSSARPRGRSPRKAPPAVPRPPRAPAVPPAAGNQHRRSPACNHPTTHNDAPSGHHSPPNRRHALWGV